jgi:hypothetical protein
MGKTDRPGGRRIEKDIISTRVRRQGSGLPAQRRGKERETYRDRE